MDSEKQLKTGTTTVGIRLKNAVVLAADMKATMGNLSYDEESQKLYKITDSMALTNAGVVGDSLTIIRFLKGQAKLYEIERETNMTVKAAATLLSNVLNSTRYYPFMVQFIIGGVNSESEMWEITPNGGILERSKYAATGSGTELAIAILDQGYTENMSEEDAIRLAIKAIKAGVRRDIYSGGKGASVMVIDKDGARDLSPKEIEKFSA